MTDKQCKNEIRVALIALAVCILTLVLSSCGEREMTTSRAMDIVTTTLAEKYGESFTVIYAEKKEGKDPSDTEYSFRMKDDDASHPEFDAVMDGNGENVEDNYARVLFGEETEEEMRGIIGKYPKLEVIGLAPECRLTKDSWTETEDYLTSDDFYLRGEIVINADTKESGLKEAYAWMSEMNEKGYAFKAKFQYGEEVLSVSCDKMHSLQPLSKIEDGWKKAGPGELVTGG